MSRLIVALAAVAILAPLAGASSGGVTTMTMRSGEVSTTRSAFLIPDADIAVGVRVNGEWVTDEAYAGTVGYFSLRGVVVVVRLKKNKPASITAANLRRGKVRVQVVIQF